MLPKCCNKHTSMMHTRFSLLYLKLEYTVQCVRHRNERNSLKKCTGYVGNRVMESWKAEFASCN